MEPQSRHGAPPTPSPLSLVCMVVNPPQTRKSGTTAAMKEIGKVIDKTVRACAGAGKQPNSCVLSVFTEAALFQRASADITAECPRTHFSTALAMDENYRFLQMLGLKPANHGKQSSLVPTNGASQFNELMQTGMAELACKTAGGVSCNVCAVGNLHPNCFLALTRGEVGNHEAACMERLLFLCGRPIPAHAELPESQQTTFPFARYPKMAVCMGSAWGKLRHGMGKKKAEAPCGAHPCGSMKNITCSPKMTNDFQPDGCMGLCVLPIQHESPNCGSIPKTLQNSAFLFVGGLRFRFLEITFWNL